MVTRHSQSVRGQLRTTCTVQLHCLVVTLTNYHPHQPAAQFSGVHPRPPQISLRMNPSASINILLKCSSALCFSLLDSSHTMTRMLQTLYGSAPYLGCQRGRRLLVGDHDGTQLDVGALSTHTARRTIHQPYPQTISHGKVV